MFSCFTDKEFLKRFLKITLPVMIGAFISFIVSFLDNIMVGTVSNATVSGIYAANQVSFIFNLAAFGILEGAGIFIEQYNGTKDYEHIKQCHRYKYIVITIFLVVTLPLIYLFGKNIIYIYCRSDAAMDEILLEGTNYLYIIAISFIPFCFGQVFSSTLRETGNTKVILYSGGIAIFTNFILNILFIVVLQMGGTGAAIATLISRIFELLFLIIYTNIKKYPFMVGTFKSFSIEKTLSREITRKGIVFFINEIGFAVGGVLQSMAFSQRDGVLSSISIVNTISNIFQILITGLSTGIGVMVGSRLGANQFEEAKDENFKLNLIGFYASIVVGIVLISLSKVLPLLFPEVDAVQKTLASKLIIVYSVLLCFNTISLTSYFTLKVGGKVVETLLLDTGCMLMFYVPIAWIIAIFTNLDLFWIYLIVRALDIVKATVGIILVRRGGWVRNITV